MRGGTRLWPREHGAYVECLAPLVTALVVSPSWIGVVFALGVVAAFAASEPVRILLGRRGARAAGQLQRPALVQGVFLSVAALGAWIVWLVQVSSAERAAAGATLVLGVAVAAAVARRADKSLAGELLIATALASALVPTGIAGSLGLADLTAGAVAWAIVFALQTLTVHAVKSRRRVSSPGVAVWAVGTLALTAAAPSGAFGAYPWISVGVVVAGVLSIGVASRRPHPRALRRVGWSFAVLDVLVLGLVAVDLLGGRP